MIPSGLSFQQAPPASVPLRFFLTAPLFLLAAAALLTIEGPGLMADRHTLFALAVTHLLTLGFTTMTMCGALLQLLPVLAGITLPHPKWAAGWVHALLTCGAACLAAALLSGNTGLAHLAMTALSISFGYFLAVMVPAFWKTRSLGPFLMGVRAALSALLVTATFGLVLGIARYGGPAPVSYDALAGLHPLWGIGGWTVILIMGLAYSLVPMFLLTSPYPALMTSWLIPGLLLMLGFRTLGDWLPGFGGLVLATSGNLGFSLGCLWFASTTLRLLKQRKRKLSDMSLPFWQAGSVFLMLAGIFGLLLEITDSPHVEPLRLTIVMLVLPGFILAIIHGMLYKIVPFLTWFHLQSTYPAMGIVPNVRQIQAAFHGEKHGLLFIAAVVTLAAACWLPIFSRLAGVMWMMDAIWLEWNLLRAAAMFRSVRKVARTAAAH
jgi:hypothetical protein